MGIEIYYALLLGASVGMVAGYLGSVMISKRMALVGGAFGHLALPGVSLALLYDIDVSLGALLMLIGGVLMIWALHYFTKLPFEALTGVIFATSLALSFLVLPNEDIDVALLGDISQITPLSVLVGVVASVSIFFVVHQIYSRLILGSISEDIAITQGINMSLTTFWYLLSIGLVVALGVRIVGGLMTAALVTIPAATSSNLSRSLGQYAWLSGLFGALSSSTGIMLHGLSGLPVGPLIILSSSVLFFLSLLVKR